MISGNKKNSALFFQILIITLAFLVVPAAANAPPTVIEGTLMIDGEPAPVGTEVELVVDGNVVGQTTVTNEGLIGDERANRLGVSSDYDIVTVYVNGEPKQTLDLSANDDVVGLDLSVTGSVEETPEEEEAESSETKTSATTGGSGGFSSGETETADMEENLEEDKSASEPVSQVSEETTFSSTTEEPVEETANEENTPESVFGSSMIFAVGLILVGIVVVSYRYRSK